MALETGTHISDLNAANPTSVDSLAQADDHLRLIKSTVKASFPNIAGAMTVKQQARTALCAWCPGSLRPFGCDGCSRQTIQMLAFSS